MTGWNIDLPSTQYLGIPTDADKLQALINELMNQEFIAIDTETTGLVVWKDLPLYWSLAWQGRRATLHAGLLHHFKCVFDNPRISWVLANAKYDMHILANVGITLAGKAVDIQVMHALLYEDKPHDLKFIANHILGWTWASFEDQFGKIGKKQSAEEVIRRAEKENMALLVEYAANDAWGTLGSFRKLVEQLQAAPTHSLFSQVPPYIVTLWDLFWKVEVPYTTTLWRMERHGVKVDRQRLEMAAPEAEKEIERIEREIARLAGRVINPKSPQQLRKWLLDERKLSPVRFTKGGKTGVRSPSVDENFLERHADDPGVQLLTQHRSYSKLYGTYIMGLHELLDPRDRIHTRYNQDVARCMPASELVLTSRGYLPVENVRVGDQVITHRGRTRPVVATSQHPAETIYRVKLTNGLILRTNGAHPYHTNGEWVRADELRAGYLITVHSDPEEWSSIPGWADFEASSWGRIYNKKTRRFLTQRPKGKWGHLKVSLYRNGAQERGEDRKDVSVHQLVLQAFGRWEEGKETRHLNGIAWDNTLKNLVCGTSKENRQDALVHGTMSQRRAGRTVLDEEDVQRIKSLGSPGQPPSTTSKLTYELAEDIRGKYARGRGRAELAREYDVSYVAIDNIVKDKTWTKGPHSGPTAEQLADEYGVSAGTIRDIWAGRRWQHEDYIAGKVVEFSTSRVMSITLESEEEVYGLTIEEDNSHVTGGIVTHNTGRLSSSNPNLQNIPIRENDMWHLRDAFIPEEGNDIIAVDYMQLEMRLLAAAAMEPKMIQIFAEGKDIHIGNVEMVFDIPYDDVVNAKNVDKKVKSGELPAEALTDYVQLCLRRRNEIKSVGFGQPDSQAEVKPAQNGETYRRKPKAIPCCLMLRVVYRLGGDGPLNKRAESRVVIPQALVDTAGAPKLTSVEWDIRNGYGSYVAGAARSSYRRVRTASGASHADGSTTSNITGSVGTTPTRRKAATRRAATTMPGKAALLLSTTASWRSFTTVTSANDVVRVQLSSTTRTGTERTPTRTTSRYFASGATKCSIVAQRTYRKRWSSNRAGVPSVTRGSNHQGHAASTAPHVVEKEQRDSQCPRKLGVNTLNYGMGPYRLAYQLGISDQAAKDLIERYMGTYPAVQQFFKEAVQETLTTGYAFTILGRRRNVPEIMSYRKDERAQGERIATNTQIQGSAADVCKMAQINLDRVNLEGRYGCKQLMQVHDELVFECPKENVELAIAEIVDLMEHPFSHDLAVHLGVDAGSGTSWDKAK